VKPAHDDECVVELGTLGDRLSALRLREAPALEAMRRSLARHGQLRPLVVFANGDGLEIIDGFKRACAARALGWSTIRVCVVDAGPVEAKVLLAVLHERSGLTELEEGWLIRSLYREDNLSQGAIAQRLGRHKSWVCRRLILVEALEPAVQADVRLGLIAPRAAVAVGQLPRGNQHAAAGVVIRRGLTVRQTELFVAELLDCPSDTARTEQIERRMGGFASGKQSAERPNRAMRNEADWMAMDIRTLRQIGARLEKRLLDTPLSTLGDEAAALIMDSLVALSPVLRALGMTMDKICGENAPRRKDAA